MARPRRKTLDRKKLAKPTGLAAPGFDVIPKDFVKTAADQLEFMLWNKEFDKFWDTQMVKLPTGSSNENLKPLENLCRRAWLESRLAIFDRIDSEDNRADRTSSGQ